VTFRLKLYVPVALGVPEIAPLDGVKLNPEGNEPEVMLQVYGAVPPLAASVALYAVPCLPLGNELVVILSAVLFADTVMLRAWVALFPVES